MKDYYQILGVPKAATEAEIKTAFRKLAHQHHPDKAGGNNDKFKEINEAYQVLGNQEKRAQYDRFGSAYQNNAGGQGAGANGFGGFDFSQGGQGFNINMDDLGEMFGGFGDIFGFGGGRQQQRQQRGADLQTVVQLNFREAMFGCDKEVRLKKPTACSDCRGSGAQIGYEPETCTVCHGSGRVVKTQRTILGNMQVQTTCDHCGGQGKIITHPCPRCHGQGIVNEQTTLTVKIPAGIADGETMRVSGQGEASPRSGQAGDLYLQIRVGADDYFVREGYNLRVNVPISFSQAVLGAKIEIRTVDGPVDLKIPEGTISGKILILKNKGVPILNGHGRGDQLVEVEIKVPKSLNRQQKKVLEELKEQGL